MIYVVCLLAFLSTKPLIQQLIFNNNPNIKITKKDLKKLFEFATSGTHILFDGNYYDQIDCVAMGSPLGPVLDNLFMGFYEKQWLKEFNFCKILLYHSYVDDIICLFNCEVDAMKFFDYLNSRNSNIKFTFEKQNCVQHFLIYLYQMKMITFVLVSFVKKTSIGLYSNFTSFTPFSYKIGLIKTLLHHGFEISSSWNFFYHKKTKN